LTKLVPTASATPTLTGTLHLPERPAVTPRLTARPRRAAAPDKRQAVFTKKTAFMQRICDLMRSGHIRFINGIIPAEKAERLSDKMDDIYRVNMPLREQSRRRKRSDAGARLLMWSPSIEDRAPVHWVLMITDGRLPPDAERENWRDGLSRSSRLEITGYELVRITKPTEPRPVWTWRYTAVRESEIRESIIQVIRTRRDADLRQQIHTIWRSPGFAGIRAQVIKFGALIRSEWRRSRKPSETMPEIPARIGYIRRLPDIGVPITDLMQRRRGRRSAEIGHRDK
jgi:hypothetical protein